MDVKDKMRPCPVYPHNRHEPTINKCRIMRPSPVYPHNWYEPTCVG